MKLRKIRPKSLFAMLVKRSVIFLTLLCLLSLFLYLVGTFQGFTDSTQANILRVMIPLSVLQSIGAFYGILLDCVSVFRKKDSRYWLGAVSYAALMICGITISMASSFIDAIQRGNL